MSLLVSEIFDSVQGEGPWNGIPSTFLRLSGCPLRCRWCDTPYASHHPVGESKSVEEIVKTVAQSTPQHLVITGGEPYSFSLLGELVSGARAAGKTVTIETAGILWQPTSADLIVISPKLSHSDPLPTDPFTDSERERHLRLRSNRSALREFAAASNPLALKFVVEQEGDLLQIEELLILFPNLSPESVLLMPQARTAERLAERLRELVPLCLQKGWRLATRLQVQLWGDRRGV